MDQHSLKAHLSQALIQEQPKSVDGLVATIFHALAPLGVSVLKQNKDAILAIYDEACAAIDIPRLPEFFEVRIEAYGRRMISDAIDALGA